MIMLGPGNEDACKEACEAWPGHLQVGGGIKDSNAKEWIDKGASKVSFCDIDLNRFAPLRTWVMSLSTRKDLCER